MIVCTPRWITINFVSNARAIRLGSVVAAPLFRFLNGPEKPLATVDYLQKLLETLKKFNKITRCHKTASSQGSEFNDRHSRLHCVTNNLSPPFSRVTNNLFTWSRGNGWVIAHSWKVWKMMNKSCRWLVTHDVINKMRMNVVSLFTAGS